MMAAKFYFLHFEGYWRENEISTLPKISGVYCVYACAYHPERNLVDLRSLVFIGGADDVGDAIAESKKWLDWRKHLHEGEELCFSIAPVVSPDVAHAEAALIFHHKPLENVEHKDSFLFDPTAVVNTSGRNQFLAERCVVEKTLPPPPIQAATAPNESAPLPKETDS
jgi:hypothetical protein